MALWNDIAAARYADETLFAADLPIDLFGRDFGHTVSSDPSIPSTTGSTFEAWTAIRTVWIAFPDSWDVDLTYPAKLRVSLPVDVTLTGAEADSVNVLKLRLTSAGTESIVSTVAAISPSSVLATLILDYTASVPTGLTSLDIEYYMEPSGITASVGVSRTRGEYGPTAWVGFVQP